MAKVLFINPTVREEEEPKHIPMGIAQLAAIAIREGHQVQIYDQNAWRQDDDIVRQVLLSDNWDMIGVGGITTAYASIKKIIKLSKSICPNSLIALGGGVLTSIPNEITKLKKGCDVELKNKYPDELKFIKILINKDFKKRPSTNKIIEML